MYGDLMTILVVLFFASSCFAVGWFMRGVLGHESERIAELETMIDDLMSGARDA